MRIKLLGALVALASLLGVGTAAAQTFPARIDLPDGWQPEGIAARGNTLYVGSIPTGAVYRVNARTGRGRILVQGATGRAAIGLKPTARRLYVAGGATGKAFAYDVRTGRLLRELQLSPPGEPTFVNDVVVTRRAAYFTDSRRGALYIVHGDLTGARALPLPDVTLEQGNNLNGIVATPDGATLLAVQTNAGRLWRIDAATGRAGQVDPGGTALVNGDGLLLAGRTLYAMQNRANQIAVLRLDAGYTRGTLVRTITHPQFDVPTTVARIGPRLYAVNARFGAPPSPTNDYWINAVRR